MGNGGLYNGTLGSRYRLPKKFRANIFRKNKGHLTDNSKNRIM